MPETRITNKRFFSNSIPRIPTVGGETPENEGPTIPTGNGDVGTPTGAAEITLGAVPNITRVSHAADIFVAQGTQMSISYQIDGPGSLFPKGGYEDMIVSYSADGRVMTLTWDCPADEPGDSTYIGAEVWVHGATATTEAYGVHWDRLHIGKTVSDLKYIGSDTSWPVLYPGLAERTDYVAGNTAIISNDTYAAEYDFIGIGFSGGNNFNSNFPSGLSEIVTDEGEDFHVPLKHSNIMAETPMGVLLDREHRGGSVSLRGDARTGPNFSLRLTQAINVSGIDCSNDPLAFDIQRADSCSITYSSIVDDTNKDETPIIFGDGASIVSRASRNCNYEYAQHVGNSRFGGFNSNGDSKTVWRGILGTTAATQITYQVRVQTFCGYGAANVDWLNCWALDDALFAGGIRNSNSGGVAFPNASFITTNQSGHNFLGQGCLTLNTVKPALFSDGPSPANNFKSCVFWQKVNVMNSENTPFDSQAMISRGDHHLENVTVGKNLVPAYNDTSAIAVEWMPSSFTRVLVVNSIWDQVITDRVSDTGNGSQFTDTYVINPPTNINSNLTSSSGYLSSGLLPKDLGLHYISRIEDGSVLDQLPNYRGCKNVFAAIGRYGKRYLDQSRESYDGSGALPYVNKFARGPWFEFRRARQRYLCNSNGLDWTGDRGIGRPGVHPTDYVNSFGTDPSTPQNCPYIDDIYGVVDGTDFKLFWRPVCAAYRETITGYSVYIDDAEYLTDVDPTATSITISGVNAGTHKFELVCIDPTKGNSGKSTPVTLTR